MATIFEDNFNSYDDGDLNTQGGWAGDTNWDIQGVIIKEGAKAVKAVFKSGWGTIAKTGIGRADGRITFYARMSASNARCELSLFEGGDFKSALYFLSDGTIRYYAHNVQTVYKNYVVDFWHECQIEWRTSDHTFRYKIDDGAWTDWWDFYDYRTWATLDIVRMSAYQSPNVFFDYIAENPIPPPSPNFTDKNNYNGYLAFIQQYIRHRINDTTPWRNPQGDLLE